MREHNTTAEERHNQSWNDQSVADMYMVVGSK